LCLEPDTSVDASATRLPLEVEMDRFIEPDTSVDASATRLPLEVEMDRFIHNSNIEHYRRLIAESERNPSRDEDRHAMVLALLAEELAKDKKPLS
jgi:hypothetical protein